MFTHHFERDLRSLDFFGRPFALSRYADGEMACLNATEYRPFGSMYKTETWDTMRPSPHRRALKASLACALPRYGVGLPVACCHIRCRRQARQIARQVPEWTTFSTIFSYRNRSRFAEMSEALDLRRRVVLVSGAGGDIGVPLDLWNNERFDLDGLIQELLKVRGKPIFVAAGPMAGVIVHRYWQVAPENTRCTIVDIGSAWDMELHGKPTRSDLQKLSRMKNHECTLHGHSPCFDGCAQVAK